MYPLIYFGSCLGTHVRIKDFKIKKKKQKNKECGDGNRGKIIETSLDDTSIN